MIATMRPCRARPAWRIVVLVASVGGLAGAGRGSELPGDGRYYLYLRGAALAAGSQTAASRPVAAVQDEDGDASIGAGGGESLLVLERNGGRWYPSLSGQLGDGQGQRLVRGVIAVAEQRGEIWHVTARLLLGGLPRKRDWLVRDLPAVDEAELIFSARDGTLSGTWKLTAEGKSAQGKIGGRVEPLRAWPLPEVPKLGEHPRLLLRRQDLPALRAKAQTPWGKAMLRRLEEPGWSRSGMAVAQGLLYQLTGERKHADKARELIDADMRSGWWKAIGPIHDPAHKAVEAMLAYDLIHDACDADYHARMRGFLRDKMRFLWDYAEINSGNGHPHSNWSAQYRSAVGMVALTLLADAAGELPKPPPAWDFPNVSPPPKFKVVDGMPVLPVEDAPLRKWLFSGPLNIGLEHDGLTSLGGAASAWPTAGTAFTTKAKADERQDTVSGKYGQAILFKNARPRPRNRDVQGDDLQPLTREITARFGPVPESAVVAQNEYLERGLGSPGMIHAWRAAGLRSFQTLYFFAVIDNPAPRSVQVKLTGGNGDWYYHNSGLYVSGQWFEHGDVLWLDKGKHPVLRHLTVGQLCEAHGRHHLYDEVWLQPLDIAAVERARAVRDTEAEFRRRCLAAIAPQYESLGRPDIDAMLWLPLARHFMELYCRNAIGDRGWNIAGQCYTQHPMLTAMPFAHAWRNATGTEVTACQHLGWFLGQAAARTVFADGWARMHDYGRGGGPVGVDLYGRGFASVPPEIRPAVLWAWQRTLDLTDRKLFSAPEGAVESLDPMSAAFTFVNWPADLQAEPVLPRAIVDTQRLGYTMRNRWRDGDDIVALFTGLLHPGGDWACEGATLDLRLMGLGAEWMVRGNGHVGDDTNTVAVAGAPIPADVKQTHLATAADGSTVVSLAYSLGKGGSGLRCLAVDYSGASGAPALLAVVDQIRFTPAIPLPRDEPAAPPRSPGDDASRVEGLPAEPAATPPPNRWRLVTHLDNHVSANEGGFAITAPNGAKLNALVVAPNKARCTALEATHKIEINYRADHLGGQFTRRVVNVPGNDFFFVVVTIGTGDMPPMLATGLGPDAVVRVGGQTVRFDGAKIVLAPAERR